MVKINLQDEFSRIESYWQPRIAGELNGQHVKLVKFQGEFPWHHHEDEDELFLVVKGNFRMETRSGSIDLAQGEFLVVPRGTEHRPVAPEEVEVMLFEPAAIRNTGNLVNEFTYEPEKI